MNPRTENELRALTADPHLGGVYARPSWTDVEHLLSKLAQLRTENERLRDALKPMVRELNKWKRDYNKRGLDFDNINEDGQFGIHVTKAELEAAHALGGDDG